MANTQNLDLVKPAGTDKALVSVINSNMEKIDTFAGTTNQAISTLNSKVDAQKTIFVQLFNQTIAGSSSSVETTAFDLSSHVPSGYSIWSAEVQIRDGASFYNLPWFNPGLTQATWIERILNTSVILKNKASWSEGTSVTFTLHCRKN